MSEEKHLHEFYNAPNDADNARGRAEKERDRYYKLIHLKLSPTRLKHLSMANMAIFLSMLILLFIASVAMTKPTQSKLEKRDLAKFPTFSTQNLLSGDFMRELELYFSDTFPFRDWFVGFSAVVEESRGIRAEGVRIITPEVSGQIQQQAQPIIMQENLGASQAQNNSITENDSITQDNDNSSEVPEQANSNEMVGPISNGMFVADGMCMSLFGGSDSNAKQYAEVINTFHKELPDVQIYNMVIPTAIEFYVPEKYKTLTRSQKDTINLVYDTLDPSIKKVDAYSQLKAHKDEYVYFRTDHHWTGRGAYYAYRAFCAQAGFTPMEIKDFETRTLDNFIGTMYAQSQDSSLLKNPDYVDYYIFKQPHSALVYQANSQYNGVPHNLWGEYAQSPNSYSVFLQGDFPLIEVKTGIPNGRKIMIVKESFGNAFAPFLINHYEEVYIVDQRYFDRSAIDLIKQKGINELIFANNTFAACTPYHIQCIDALRHDNYVPYTPPKPATPFPPIQTMPLSDEAMPDTPSETTTPDQGEMQTEVQPQEKNNVDVDKIEVPEIKHEIPKNNEAASNTDNKQSDKSNKKTDENSDEESSGGKLKRRA